MADVTYLRSRELLDAYGRQIPVSNKVRLNRDEKVVYTWPGKIPYKPQPFPASPPEGWRITGVALETGHLAPMAILTDAWQMVEAWSLTPDGKYDRPTGKMVPDGHYWIHFSDLDFTWGCIRVIREADLRWLASQVLAELAELKRLDPKQAWVSMETS